MSGLPDLSLDDTKCPVTVDDVTALFNEEQDVSSKDRRMLSMFLAERDCRNLLRLLKGNGDDITQLGNLSVEGLESLVACAREGVTDDELSFPEYMTDFVREYDERAEEKGFFPDDSLMIRYWESLKTSDNRFMSDWAEFNINMSNILTAMIARSQEWNVGDYIIGENDVNDMIMTSKARDYDLGREYDYVPAIMRVMECDDPVEKEKRIDALRWVWLDDAVFFNTFSMDAVIAYLCKVQMMERWRLLDPITGKVRFEEIINSLRSEVQVPEEFTLKSPFARKD